MDVGVVTRSFRDITVADTAFLISDNRFKWIELCLTSSDANYYRYNSHSDLSDMTDKRMARIVNTYRNKGLKIPVMGVFTSLIDADET